MVIGDADEVRKFVGSACGSSFLDPLVLFRDVPGMGFEGGQMGLQKRVLNFEGFVRVKK